MVREVGLSTTDAWSLDFIEIQHLIDYQHDNTEQDLSLMLNFERVSNGAPRSFMGWK